MKYEVWKMVQERSYTLKMNVANWPLLKEALTYGKARSHMSVEQIKKDIKLRGFFFELISKNFVLGLTGVFGLKPSDYVKIQKEYYDAYLKLSKELEGHVGDSEMFDVIQEVSLYYIDKVGKLKFIRSLIDPSAN